LLTHVSEILAGRIATLALDTLKANEFYQMPLSPFYQLFGSKVTTQLIDQLKKVNSHYKIASWRSTGCKVAILK